MKGPNHLRSAELLRMEAAELEARARWLRKDAEAMEAARENRRDLQRRRDAIRHAGFAVLTVGIATAASELAHKLGCDATGATMLIEIEVRKNKRWAKALRNRLMMQLAWKGWTNKQIGDDPRVKLTEKSVSRIVSHGLTGLEEGTKHEAAVRAWRSAAAKARDAPK